MMKKLMLLLLSITLLSSCSSARMSQSVQRGKYNFEAGYYRKAFQQLLPPATDGNMEAEYAVGYMYYYGYGVSQDTETGSFWIKKSADQGYEPAVKALRSMK